MTYENTLQQTNIAMEKSPCKPSINRPFSVAMLVYQRVAPKWDSKWLLPTQGSYAKIAFCQELVDI